MATKYIVNTKKMAFQFANGKVIDRKGILAVEESELEDMERDYFFTSLKAKGVISVSKVKPSEYSSSGEIIAADNAKIKELEKQVAELQAKLEKAEATGKETATVIDSSKPIEDAIESEEKETSKKGSKK